MGVRFFEKHKNKKIRKKLKSCKYKSEVKRIHKSVNFSSLS